MLCLVFNMLFTYVFMPREFEGFYGMMKENIKKFLSKIKHNDWIHHHIISISYRSIKIQYLSSISTYINHNLIFFLSNGILDSTIKYFAFLFIELSSLLPASIDSGIILSSSNVNLSLFNEEPLSFIGVPSIVLDPTVVLLSVFVHFLNDFDDYIFIKVLCCFREGVSSREYDLVWRVESMPNVVGIKC